MQVQIEESWDVRWFAFTICAVARHAVRLVDLPTQLGPCFPVLRPTRIRALRAITVNRSEPVDRRYFADIDVQHIQAGIEGPAVPLRSSQVAGHCDVAL